MVKNHVHLRPIVGDCALEIHDYDAFQQLPESVRSLLSVGHVNFNAFQAALDVHIKQTVSEDLRQEVCQKVALALGFELSQPV